MLTDTLQEKIRLAIVGRNTLEEFVTWFEDWFLDEFEKDTTNTNKTIHGAISDLYGDIGYFEPLEPLRQEDHRYYGTERLMDILEEMMRILTEQSQNDTNKRRLDTLSLECRKSSKTIDH